MHWHTSNTMDVKYMTLIVILNIFFVYVNLVCGRSDKYVDINEVRLVNTNSENPTPILGILTQEVSHLILKKYPNECYKSYIAASYVKYVEGAGGRVVPIWIGRSRDYYRDILSKINGVLLPGGATYFNQSNGYAEAGHYMYEIAKEMNDNGTYFPIWGTCLGFELMVYLSANSTEARTYCSSSSQALPLEFKDNFRKSRLLRNASDNIIDTLKNYAVTANFHLYCYTEETFAKMKLNELWNVISVNHDWHGIEFISTIEHKKYPFYGTQFHPEKNIYEFIANRNITHTSRAIQASQYFANFLVNEARHNYQHFKNESEEIQHLIYNYSPVYTGLKGSSFEQQYLFKSERNAAITFKKFNSFKIVFNLISGWLIYKCYL